MKQGEILIVDDNLDLLKSLQRMLKFDFEKIMTASDPKKIPSILSDNNIDLVLLDMNFTEGDQSGSDGLYWLQRIKKIDNNMSVVLITAYGDIEVAVKAIQKGASDFITKPWEPPKLIATLQNVIELSKTKKEVKQLKQVTESVKQEIDNRLDPVIGNSEAIAQVLDLVKKVAKTDTNILILGENGTGKELIAREIHQNSERKNQIFLSVDLNTINQNLFESELFGHVKGAFTDAKEDKIGRIETASGGTLFLDEIGNLPLSLQAKLLTVIQNREFTPVGASKPVKFDVRLLCATNKDLDRMIAEQLFRKDLFFRINTIEIKVPPLRNRKDDVLTIAEYFLNRYAYRYNKPNLKFNKQAVDSMLNYNWPGNIRELKHIIERVSILSESNIIGNTDLFPVKTKSESDDLFTLNLNSLEKLAIEKALEKSKGNISKASKLLDISRTSLYSKMAKHGI
ncbi:MAG: sigma-54 dependent transcriptional regulator [Bacteroidales bacterium]|nr:sigma-54 dependent transcriptional regulator [Bacteroidales bacterium]